MARISAVIDDKTKEWLFYETLDLQTAWLRNGRNGDKPTESFLINQILTEAALSKIKKESKREKK